MYFIVGGRRTVINERKSLHVLYGIHCITRTKSVRFLSIYVLTRICNCIVSYLDYCLHHAVVLLAT